MTGVMTLISEVITLLMIFVRGPHSIPFVFSVQHFCSAGPRPKTGGALVFENLQRGFGVVGQLDNG